MTADGLEAVVFDFDGTIFDSETPIYRASAAALAEMGLDLTIEGWATAVGLGEDDLFRLAHDRDRRPLVDRGSKDPS